MLDPSVARRLRLKPGVMRNYMEDTRRKEKYEAALSMYHREHDRWYQWALFFFAGIGAAFYIAGEYRLRLWMPSAASAVISLLWVFAASSIRASTSAWQATLRHFETYPESRKTAFRTFERLLDSYGYRHDFCLTLLLLGDRRYLRVTRILVWSGLLGILLFSLLAILDSTCQIEPKACTVGTFSRGSA